MWRALFVSKNMLERLRCDYLENNIDLSLIGCGNLALVKVRNLDVNKLYDVTMSISRDVYSKDVLLKVAYLFSNRAYIHIELFENKSWIINIKMKDGFESVRPEEFENELLAETVRCQILNKTRSIRELLLARALSSSMVEDDNIVEKIVEEQDNVLEQELDNILEDWFDKNER